METHIRGATNPRHLPRWIFAVVFFWMLLTAVPGHLLLFGAGLDASMIYGFNMAHVQHLVFGRDIVFTFGPLGYLLGPIPGLADPLAALAFAWAIPVLFLFGAFVIWRALGSQWIVLASWAILTGAMLLTGLPHERMRLAFLSVAIGIAALLAVRGEVGYAYLAFAGAVAGLMTLVKINEGISGSVVLFCILLTWFTMDRIQMPVPPKLVLRHLVLLALVPLFALVAGFVLVERNISSVWAFATRSLEIALGYSEAVSLTGPVYEVAVGIFSLAAIGVVIPLLAGGRREVLKGLLPALGAGFFAFKSAVVRQDAPHASSLQINLAVAGLFLLVCARNTRDRWLVISCVAASFCFGAIEHLKAFPGEAVRAERRAILLDMPAVLSDNWHWGATWARADTWTRQVLDGMRAEPAITKLVSSGTVDAVPMNIALVHANAWKWAPRPVFQSYVAFTPALDELNARHLASHASADHMILQWGDVDGKHPLLDDAASWRSLFDHYDVELTRPGVLVLKRRDSSRYGEPRLIGSATAGWQSEIAIPDAGQNQFTMMRAEIGKSMYGRLLGILLRNSSTFVNATYSSGIHVEWRVTRANLIDGAFISYLPETIDKMLPYFGQPGDEPPDRVVSIRFETAGETEFSSVIRISWYALAAQPNEPVVSSDTTTTQRPAPKISRMGVFRSAEGLFLLDATGNSASGPTPYKLVRFGSPGDIPVAGDWDGTGVVRIGVYRPLNAHWYLDMNNNGKWDGSGPGPDLDIAFGSPSGTCMPSTAAGLAACQSIPIVGDWTGTGVSKLGIFMESRWLLDKKNPADSGPHSAATTYNYGSPGDLPVAANWNRTGAADQIGVYRRGTWFVDSNGDGVFESTDATYIFGSPADFPVTGNWRGIGAKRIGVLAPSGQWFLDINGDHAFTLPFDSIVHFGQPGDLPVVGGPWAVP